MVEQEGIKVDIAVFLVAIRMRAVVVEVVI